MTRATLTLLCALISGAAAADGRFYNLAPDAAGTADSTAAFTTRVPLSGRFADSIYTVSIVYPEFGRGRQPGAAADSTGQSVVLPPVSTSIGVERKAGVLYISFTPVAKVGDRSVRLTSFALDIKATPRPAARRAPSADAGGRYASNSVLSQGRWAKIRVSQTGFHQLTDELIRKAGFKDPARVRIYGYGGALQPESLTADYLASTDDLPEVATCTIAGRRVFWAQGPVSWTKDRRRERNTYSDYGYYFLTESDTEPLQTDSTALLATYRASAESRCSIYEQDGYSWFRGGRHLFDTETIAPGQHKDYTLPSPSPTARVYVALTASGQSTAQIALNDSTIGTIRSTALAEYQHAKLDSLRRDLDCLNVGDNTITITNTGSAELRLDYITLTSATAAFPAPDLATATLPAPEYVYGITNQNHHADPQADMVIVIPTSQKYRDQAERLAAIHRTHDRMNVTIVPADELFNEFSSGTPDANAYRRYVKMLYDRAQTAEEAPSHLILFGDCAWDNRMKVADWRGSSPDDYLLCYESDNSVSDLDGFVTDDFFTLLDDSEPLKPQSRSSSTYVCCPDIAVGRLPARTPEQAKILVDKIETYITDPDPGVWQNTVLAVADDGNSNIHMRDTEVVAAATEEAHPEIGLRRIYFDAYKVETSASGNRYPQVTKLLRQYMRTGAAVIDYTGHGNPTQLSHELVLQIADFEAATSPTRLPLWIAAACDVSVFDAQIDNIGEAAVLNPNGGAIAFYASARTVYSSNNAKINAAFMREALRTGQEQVSIGEASRRAKVFLVEGPFDSAKRESSELTVNRLQYNLLGDPALRLPLPNQRLVVDSINGTPVGPGLPPVELKAGQEAVVAGHAEASGATDTEFDGTATLSVYDERQQVVCRDNENPNPANKERFTYYDRTATLFTGSDRISGGQFTFRFPVPKDISYSGRSGQLSIFAFDSARGKRAAAADSSFVLRGSVDFKADSVGPSVHCYLNSPSFANGGSVNASPYFRAELYDDDGINASGGGFGHDMLLTVDGKLEQTYIVNDSFTFDFGTYRSGSLGYQLPALDDGPHTLHFRAWDVLNNASDVSLSFTVDSSLPARLYGVSCTCSPAIDHTVFRITHDRPATEVQVDIDVFDTAGRNIWAHRELTSSAGTTLEIPWDLTTGGQRLTTGVYIYRVRLTAGGSTAEAKPGKLIVYGLK